MSKEAVAARLRDFAELCRQKGLPVTMQRRVILETVLERDDHPTADQIYEAVHERIAQLSRTTVYRALETLLQLGVIRRVHHTGTVARFDGMIGRHHHLICTECNKIVDLADESLDRLALPKHGLQGFEVEDFSVQFFGICAACRKRRKSGV